MPPPRNVPCGWVPDLTGCTTGPCCPGAGDFDPAIAALASDVAAQILWALSGRIFGCCEITVRPCRKRDCQQLPLAELVYWDGRSTTNLGVGMGFVPLLLADGVHNITCGCLGFCTCEAACEWLLPGPVCSITEILVDGVVVPASNYAVFDYNKLIFQQTATAVVPAAHLSHIALSPNAVNHDPSEQVCLSVAPTATTNTAPAGPGCFVSSGVSNMTFTMPSVLSYDFAYTRTNGPGSLGAITNGGVLPSDVYEFPANILINPGDVEDSAPAADGSFVRMTAISGATTTNLTGRLNLTEDFAASFEFFAPGVECPPTCQDFALPPGEPGTWSVRYLIGEEVPTAANLAAGQYACELARALIGDANCRLPRNVQSVARQGIDIAFADPFALAEAGLTGLPLVDLWLRSVNPNHLAERPYVWSPDLPRARRQTSP